MYIKLENQEQIILQAIEKGKGYRKLSKILNVPRSSLLGYRQGWTIPQERFEKIITFLGINQKELKFSKLEKNWRQIIGGKNCVIAKKQKGIFESQLKNAQIKGVIKIRKLQDTNIKQKMEKK